MHQMIPACKDFAACREQSSSYFRQKHLIFVFCGIIFICFKGAVLKKELCSNLELRFFFLHFCCCTVVD